MDAIDQFRYQSYEVEALVRTIEIPNPFLLSKFFSSEIKLFDTPVIEWDIEEGGRRLAPFVSPLVQGREIRSQGFATYALKPAYIKPKKTLRPGGAFTRLPGEAYGGTLTPRQRMDRKLADQIKLHNDMLENRLEWMSAKALVDGAITISGEDYQSVTVTFGQHSDLRDTLGGSVEWDDANGDPFQDIEDMALDIRRLSYGAIADTVVMDGQAWKLFRNKMITDKRFDSTLRLGENRVNAGPRNGIDGELVGNLGGRFSIWVYDGAYEDDSGVSQPFLPAYTAIVASSSGIQGKQYFGAIEDFDAEIQAMRIFHKTWPTKDPSGLTLLSQSAPALAPKRRNAYGRITVKTP